MLGCKISPKIQCRHTINSFQLWIHFFLLNLLCFTVQSISASKHRAVDNFGLSISCIIVCMNCAGSYLRTQVNDCCALYAGIGGKGGRVGGVRPRRVLTQGFTHPNHPPTPPLPSPAPDAGFGYTSTHSGQPHSSLMHT